MAAGARADLGSFSPEQVRLPAMFQRWESLTFLHWPYEPAAVQGRLPSGLEVDTYGGSAWIGITPFLARLALPLTPAEWLLEFPETNVRTYVKGPDGKRGIWFFSLDAAHLAAVLGARTIYRLPYKWSEMRVEREGRTVRYSSRRKWPSPAQSEITIETGEPLEAVGELELFLTARWRFYTVLHRGLGFAQVEHPPWPLQRARVVKLELTLFEAAGLAVPGDDPLVHYSPGVDVRVGPPQPV